MASGGGPAIVLVRPQLGENIGTAARAMLNCGLTDLRIVNPRDGWPSLQAVRAAAGADVVIDRARIFTSAEEAVAGLHRVFATTARPRDMIKPVMTPEAAALEIRRVEATGQKCGILFGAERTGLDNEELVLADTIVEAPLNPAYRSLNLAQAVLLVSHAWYRLADETPPVRLEYSDTRPATRDEFLNFCKRLESALDESRFLFPPAKRPAMVRNIRNMFHRMTPTEQDLRTLHGIVASLFSHRPKE